MDDSTKEKGVLAQRVKDEAAALAAQKPQTPTDTIRSMIASNMNRITQALPAAGVTPERLATIAFSAIRKSPTLMECSQASLIECIIKSAELGLNPGLLGQCHMVPFAGEATFIIGYQGMLELARRSGSIAMIYAKPVFEHDEFSYSFGLTPTLHHVPYEGDQPKEWENVKYVYMVARFTNGGYHFGVMTRADIEAHRDKFAKGLDVKKFGAYTSPWRTNPVAMALKTVIRQEWKYLPVATEIREIVAQVEQMEADTIEGRATGVWTAQGANAMLSDGIPKCDPEPVVDVEPVPAATKAKSSTSKKKAEAAPEPSKEPEAKPEPEAQAATKDAYCRSCGQVTQVTADAEEIDVARICCPNKECARPDLTLAKPAAKA